MIFWKFYSGVTPYKVVVPKAKSLQKKVLLWLEVIFLVVSYERKDILFYEKNLKFSKNNTFDNIFCNRIFPYYRFLPIFFQMIGFL